MNNYYFILEDNEDNDDVKNKMAIAKALSLLDDYALKKFNELYDLYKS